VERRLLEAATAGRGIPEARMRRAKSGERRRITGAEGVEQRLGLLAVELQGGTGRDRPDGHGHASFIAPRPHAGR